MDLTTLISQLTALQAAIASAITAAGTAPAELTALQARLASQLSQLQGITLPNPLTLQSLVPLQPQLINFSAELAVPLDQLNALATGTAPPTWAGALHTQLQTYQRELNTQQQSITTLMANRIQQLTRENQDLQAQSGGSNGGGMDWKKVWAFAAGAVTGMAVRAGVLGLAAATGGAGLIAIGLAGFAAGGLSHLASHLFNDNAGPISWRSVLKSATIGAIGGEIFGAVLPGLIDAAHAAPIGHVTIPHSVTVLNVVDPFIVPDPWSAIIIDPYVVPDPWNAIVIDPSIVPGSPIIFDPRDIPPFFSDPTDIAWDPSTNVALTDWNGIPLTTPEAVNNDLWDAAQSGVLPHKLADQAIAGVNSDDLYWKAARANDVVRYLNNLGYGDWARDISVDADNMDVGGRVGRRAALDAMYLVNRHG